MRCGPRALIGVAAVVTAALVLAVVRSRSTDHVVTAGFWFEASSDDAPALTAAHGGPLTADEQRRVRTLARQALAEAFAGLRIAFVDAPAGHYRVRVIPAFAPRHWPMTFSVAESRTFGPMGGEGAISFAALSAMAVTHAPGGATRAMLIDAIGRGLGRVAAHEFAHQILPDRQFHLSQDEASYDFASVGRTAQFYGPMRWDLAGPWLQDALGEYPGVRAAQ